MDKIKKNKIPKISNDRLEKINYNSTIEYSKEDKAVCAFLKNQELVQPLTIRIPMSIYVSFKRKVFEEDKKMNRIIVELIKKYID